LHLVDSEHRIALLALVTVF